MYAATSANHAQMIAQAAKQKIGSVPVLKARERNLMKTPSTIAVWNTAFLGDAVLTLPLLGVLKAAFPDAGLDFYVRAGLEPLFAAQPEIRQVYGVNKKARSPRLLWREGTLLRERGYDLWINAHPSFRSALMARLGGSPWRIGYRGGLRDFAHTDAVPRRFKQLDEIERLLQLLRPVRNRFPSFFPPEFDPDCAAGPGHWPRLVLPAEAEHKAETFFAALPLAPCLGLHPGSVWATKRWTTGGFATIARRAADTGAHVLVFAGPGEEDMAAAVIEQAGLRGHPRLHDLSCALSLPELAAWLKRLDVYVSNDSGPLHLAWCQHTPVTALFGPTVRELGFFPRGDTANVFEVDRGQLPCRPCGLHGAKVCPQGHHRCMKDIDAEAVWHDVAAKLHAAPVR